MNVLLVVDPQRDFCPGGALAVPEGDAIVPVIQKLLNDPRFSLRIVTKDWHPPDHISFFDNHAGRQPFETVALGLGSQTLWPRHCQQNTPGAQLYPGLTEASFDHVVLKGTRADVDSYSGFFDNNREHETELRSLLEQAAAARGISRDEITITVCGLALDYCVLATLRDAVSLGYRCELALDACRAVNLNPGDDLAALRELAALGVTIRSDRELAHLGRRSQSIQLPA